MRRLRQGVGSLRLVITILLKPDGYPLSVSVTRITPSLASINAFVKENS